MRFPFIISSEEEEEYEHEKEDVLPLLGSQHGSAAKTSDTNTISAHSLGRIRSIAASCSRLTRDWTVIDSMQHSFNPSIEGLRGIAVSLTMLSHIMDYNLNLFREVAGTMGVTIFFVLSGFLITAVLIRAKSKNTSTTTYLARFYADRFFRLGPALILVVVGIYICHVLQGDPDLAATRGYGYLALFSLTNWSSLFPHRGTDGPWGNTWSLACEEQFYLMWSLLLPFILARRQRVRLVLIAGLTGSLLFVRVWTSMYEGSFFGTNWHFGLWSNVWKMVIGSSLRIIPTPTWLLRRSSAYLGLAGLISILLASTTTNLTDLKWDSIVPGWNYQEKPVVIFTDFFSAVFTSLILSGTSGEQGSLAILELHPLRFMGRISYSWYLWQLPILLLNKWPRNFVAVGVTAFAFVVAMCSTVYVEEPVNNAYKRWKARRDSVHHAQSVA
ncbi:hypothetical protein CBS101457_005060 [Exobasidium rhododendri]|nr:hypothetical protein CBS101457_005060 [Exobasidium rhododendri]